MTASEIRALFSVASRPEVVSLAGGMPYLSALPMDTVAETVQQLLSHPGRHRAAVRLRPGRPAAARADPRGDGAGGHPAPTPTTSSSRPARSRRSTSSPGSSSTPATSILAEAPSYVGALGVFAAYQAEVVHVTSDDDGLVPAALEERIVALAGGRPADQVPLHRARRSHNPAGVDALGAAAPADPRDLRAARHPRARGQPLRPARLRRRAATRRCAPCPRRAWSTSARSPRRSRPGCGSAGPSRRTPCARSWSSPRESAILCPSASRQMTVSSYLAGPRLAGADQGLPRALPRAARRDARAARAACCPRRSLDAPRRRLLRLGHPARRASNAKAMLPRAVTERVAYAPGTGFFADGTGHRYARLSYCYPDPDRIREGVRRLRRRRARRARADRDVRHRGRVRGRLGRLRAAVQMPGPDSF